MGQSWRKSPRHFVTLVPSAKGFGSKLKSDVSGDVGGVGRSLGSTFGKLFVLGAGVIAAAGIGSFLKDSIVEARDAQKTGAATTAILKATGGAANLSAKQIGTLASSLSAKTAVDDEQIQAGANLLLTFKNVKREGSGLNDVFGRATAAGLDLAAAGFGSVEGNAKQLGKALNDPIKGISALSKAGVTFTAAQQSQIKGFVASNDLLSAQKIILGEVEHQVGGTAAATATSGEKAAVAFGNIKEAVGTALLPVIDGLFNLFLSQVPRITALVAGIGPAFSQLQAFLAPTVAQASAFIDQFSRGVGIGGAFAGALSTVSSAVGAAFGFINANRASFAAFVGVIGAAAGIARAYAAAQTLINIALTANPIGLAVVAIAALVAGLVIAYNHSETFRNGVNQAFNLIKAQFLPVLQQVANTFLTVIVPALTSFVGYVASALMPIFLKVAGIITGQVIPIITSLATFFLTRLFPAISQIVTAVAQNLKPIFDQLVATFQSRVLPAIQSLLGKFQEAQPTIQRVALVVVQVIGKVLEFAAAILGKVVPAAIRLVGFLLGNIIPAIGSVIGAVVKIVGKMLDFGGALIGAGKSVADFATKVGNKISEVVTFFITLPIKIGNALAGLPGQLLSIGGNIVAGLANGIRAGAGRVLDAVQSLINLIPKKMRSFFGIASPSKLTTILGEYIGDGLAKGLTNSSRKVTKAMEKVLDKAKGAIEQRISDFKSLSSSIGDNFAGGLFSVTASDAVKNDAGDVVTAAQTVGQNFLSGLTATRNDLSASIANLKTLQGFGLSAPFLTKLFADGSAPLIGELAANKDLATASANLFGGVQALSVGLGDSVATLAPDIGGGYTLADLNATLKETNALLSKVPQDPKGKGDGGSGPKGKGGGGGKDGKPDPKNGRNVTYQFQTFDLPGAMRESRRRESFAGSA